MPSARRKWWAAALLSIAVPGLGQVYNGQGRKGLRYYSYFWLLVVASLLMLALAIPPFNIAIPILTFVSAYLSILIEAIITARRLGDTYQPKIYTRWYLYLLAIAISGFVVQPALTYAIRGALVQAYKLPTGGMLPTLLIGDRILVDKFSYRFTNPDHGEIIVFKFPQDERRDFIKRVIGLPGETVEIREKQVLIDGRPLEEAYAMHLDTQIMSNPPSPRDSFAPVIVPEGHLFVMGDNRDHSLDSRFWGFLDRSKVKGKVRTIYWSWDSTTNRVRWQRIGQPVR